MTELEDMNKEIDELIIKVRPQSLKKLLVLYRDIFNLGEESTPLGLKDNKVHLSTKNLQKRMRFMSNKYLAPQMRVVRDYKNALEALLLISDYHGKLLKYYAEQLQNENKETIK